MRARALAFPLLVLAATAVGFALRCQRVGAESLWFDEVSQVEWTDQPLLAFLRERWQQVDPPLNELIAWIWNNTMRANAPELLRSELWVRLPVVLFGALTIPAVAFAARAASGPAPGVIAAFLVATNPYLVRYSQEARMYALTTFCAAVALWGLVRALGAEGKRRHVWCFAIFSIAAALSHFYAILVLGAAAAATAVAAWRATRGTPLRDRLRYMPWSFRSLLTAEAAALVLLLAYVGAAALQVSASGQGTRPWLSSLGAPGASALARAAAVYGSDFLGAYLPVLAPGTLDGGILWSALSGLALAFLFGLATRRPGEPAALHSHLVAMALVPTILVVALSYVRPIYHVRYLMASLPAIVLVLARGRAWAAVALLSAPAVLLGIAVQPRYHTWLEKPNYREAAQAFIGAYRPGDAIDVMLIDRLPVRYYVRQLAGPESPAYAAIDRAEEGRFATLDPSSSGFVRRPVPAGARRLVFDFTPAWGRLYAMDARAILEARLAQTDPKAPGFELLFASKLQPWFRLWSQN